MSTEARCSSLHRVRTRPIRQAPEGPGELWRVAVSDPWSRSSSHDARSRAIFRGRSEEHTSELQSHSDLVCRLLLEKKKAYPRITPVEKHLGLCFSC